MTRIRILGVVLVILALAALPAFVLAQGGTTTGPITVPLSALNGSGISGTATLSDAGNNQTLVDIRVTGTAAGASLPVHIHSGTCANLNPTPQYPLNPVVDGISTTTISTSLSSLLGGQFAVNGHKSATDISTYVFCGDITAAGGTTGGVGTPGATMTGTVSATGTPAATDTPAATAAATVAAGGAGATGTPAATTAATATVAATATTAATATVAPTATGAVGSTGAVATTTPGALPATGAASNAAPFVLLALLGVIVLGAGLAARRVLR